MAQGKRRTVTQIIIFTFFLVFAGAAISGCAAGEEAEHEATTTTKILPTDTSPPPKSIGTEVSVEGTKSPYFKPRELELLTGGRVTWTNNDKAKKTHTVTANNGDFDSDKLSFGDVFSRTFAASGDYEYHCTIHKTMTGKVIVRDKESDLTK